MGAMVRATTGATVRAIVQRPQMRSFRLIPILRGGHMRPTSRLTRASANLRAFGVHYQS